MSHARHPFINFFVAFLIGHVVGNFIISTVNGGYVYRDTVNEQIMLNPSSDGRYHTCGYITEDGVTEYIQDYIERCGDTTLAGDTPR